MFIMSVKLCRSGVVKPVACSVMGAVNLNQDPT